MDITTEEKVRDLLLPYLPASLTKEGYKELMDKLAKILKLDLMHADKPHLHQVAKFTLKELEEFLVIVQENIKQLEDLQTTTKLTSQQDERLRSLRLKDFELSQLIHSRRWW
jgi:hypothetical protein